MYRIPAFLLLFFSCTISWLSCDRASTESEPERPNIIFIMSDDHAYQAVSAYNERLKDAAPTPQIDRIADNGIRFDRALVTNSICSPSRATILTGKYSHLNGMIYNADRMDFDGSQQTFPKILQHAGYQTAMIGKWHLGGEPTGFDYWDIFPGQGHYYNPEFISQEGTYQEHGYVSDIITDKSLEWMEQSSGSDQPFMLMLHHKAPHREWEPGPEYLNAFEDVTFPEPGTLFDDYSGRGTAAKTQDMTIAETMRIEADLKMWEDTSAYVYERTLGRLDEEQREAWNAAYDPVKKAFENKFPEAMDGAGQKDQQSMDEELVRWKYQRYMNDYLGTIKSIDESVGRVLDYLEETGLDENTIIIYTSDQGFYLGEHGWFDKRFMYEESYRTPLVISWPGVTEPGTVNADLVSNLDFAQTFLAIADADEPDDMQGSSLVPILQGNTPENWRDAHYYHYYEYPSVHDVKRHYGITTDRYKLIHFYYDIDEWELYDLQEDPREMQNVYDDPEYAEIQQDLHERLEELRVQYKDTDEVTQSFLPED